MFSMKLSISLLQISAQSQNHQCIFKQIKTEKKKKRKRHLLFSYSKIVCFGTEIVKVKDTNSSVWH